MAGLMPRAIRVDRLLGEHGIGGQNKVSTLPVQFSTVRFAFLIRAALWRNFVLTPLRRRVTGEGRLGELEVRSR
jgi:hypothetical protein